MIRVILFASLREKLGCDFKEVSLPSQGRSVADLIRHLVEVNGPHWQQVLGDEQVMVAVNQEIAGLDACITDGDEVAFFPPVTGG